jgi:hypothetical protein
MTINHIQSVANALTELELKFNSEDDTLLLQFGGDVEFNVLINTQVDGNVINFEARDFIDANEVQNSEHRTAFALYLLKRNYQTTGGALEMNDDGKVMLTVEVPMADAQVTVKQVALIMEMLIRRQVNDVVAKGKAVLSTGELPAEQPSSSSGALNEIAQLMQLHTQMNALAESEQGRAALAQMAADENMPGEMRAIAQLVLSKSAPAEL